MKKRTRRMVLAVMALMCVGAVWAGFRVGRATAPAPPPVYLPSKTIVVEQIKEIPAEPDVKIVERVKWRTKEVAVEKEVVKEVVRTFCPLESETSSTKVEEVFAEVGVEADKFEGVLKEGGVVLFGWKGTGWCQVKRGEEGSWVELVRAPFALEKSVSVSTLLPPQLPKPFKWRLEVRAGAWTALDSGVASSGWQVGATYYPWRRVGVWADYQRGDSMLLTGYDYFESSVGLPVDRVSGGLALTLGGLR